MVHGLPAGAARICTTVVQGAARTASGSGETMIICALAGGSSFYNACS